MTYNDSLLAAYLGGCAWGCWIILAGSRDGIERATGTDALAALTAWAAVAFVALTLSPFWPVYAFGRLRRKLRRKGLE